MEHKRKLLTLMHQKIMEDFPQVESKLHVGYVVSTQYWHPRKQRLLKTRILFSTSEAAQKCLEVLNFYKHELCVCMPNAINKVEKELFFFDGDTIHALAGFTIRLDEYVSTRNIVMYIETTHDHKSWAYVDEYVKLFGLEPRRPPSLGRVLLRFFLYC